MKNKLIFKSSNPQKLSDFKALGFSVKRGADISEIESNDPLQVALYKVIDTDEDFVLVEDSSLDVEGLDIGTNIKWEIDRLKKNKQFHGKKAKWSVVLGYRRKHYVYLAKGELTGILDYSGISVDQPGFDSIFRPDGLAETLADICHKMKISISPRTQAAQALLNKHDLHLFDTRTVPVWQGSYQQE